MDSLIRAIESNAKSVCVVMRVESTIVAELQFDADDITYSDDREIYIRYVGVDVTIPIEEATVEYDENYNTYTIYTEGLEFDIIF